MKGICLLTFIPMRAEPSGRSEQVSQLIYGETYSVLEEREGWCRVVTDFDNYTGWISLASFRQLPEGADPREGVLGRNGSYLRMGSTLIWLPAGAALNEQEAGSLQDTALFSQAENAVNLARQFLGTPYLWGGRSFMGIDCSGLVQVCYKAFGLSLPRDARDQALEAGSALSFVEEAEAGDLAFFDNAEGKITHTGIVLGNQEIIHAHGEVRIDKLDQQGIFNTDRKVYTHRLRLLRRIAK